MGTVNLFQFIQAPRPGSVIGQLNTAVGVGVPLVQTNPALLGTSNLSQVDQQVATVCGSLIFLNNQLAADVLFASPGTNAAAPGVSPLALVVLSLLGLLPAAG